MSASWLLITRENDGVGDPPRLTCPYVILRKNFTFTSGVGFSYYGFCNGSPGDDVVAGYVRRRL